MLSKSCIVNINLADDSTQPTAVESAVEMVLNASFSVTNKANKAIKYKRKVNNLIDEQFPKNQAISQIIDVDG